MMTDTEARANAAEQRLRILSTARPLAEWHEDIGDVLWWRFPVEEAPYVGSPHCLGHTVELHTHDTGEGPRLAARTTIGGWPGYHTHWTPLPVVPDEPRQEDGASDA